MKETIFKTINVFAWILVIGCPILIIFKVWLYFNYGNLFKEFLNKREYIKSNYLSIIALILILFTISLSYLIVN